MTVIPEPVSDPFSVEREFQRQGLSAGYTDVKEKYHQFQCAVYQEIQRGYYLYANMDQIRKNSVPVSFTHLRSQLGRFGKNPQRYWWDWFQDNFPLFKTVKKGNNMQKTLSLVESNVPLEIILANPDPAAVFESVYSVYPDLTESDLHTVQLDTVSLDNYIAASEQQIAQGQQSGAVLDQREQNLRSARLLRLIAEATGGVLPQVVSSSEFGRTYYRGPNLQNVHRTLRHAALGRSIAVDINSSVFAWKLSFVDRLNAEQGINKTWPYTLELIREKKRIRRHLGELLFDNNSEQTQATVKQLITAIGFGARLNQSSSHWRDPVTGIWHSSAVSDIVRDPVRRQRLKHDPWMAGFLAEQQEINRLIGNTIRDQIQSLGDNTEEDFSVLKTEAGRLSANRMIAYVYQHEEAAVMAKIAAVARAEVVLQVHDSLYFKTQPDIASMNTVLQDHWPWASLSVETHQQWSYQHRDFEQEHREHIRREEAAVAELSAKSKTTENSEQRWINQQIQQLNQEPESLLPPSLQQHINQKQEKTHG